MSTIWIEKYRWNKRLVYWRNKPNKLTSKNHKYVCGVLNYIEHILFLVSIVSRCVLISAFASLLGTPIGIASFAVRLKIFVTTARIKKHKSIHYEKEKEIW